MNEKEKVLTHLDIPYSYELAKRMEAYRCNPELGYRSAGSKAEFLTGEMLKKEMEEIGSFILRVMENIDNETELLKIKEKVKALCLKFPLYQ